MQNWESAQKKGSYDFDALKTEGFIHCSLKDQVVKVANSRFRGRQDLILLQIDEAKITADVIYENLEGGHEKFPHIYGPLNLDAVLKVFPFDPNESGEFSHPERRADPKRVTIVPMSEAQFGPYKERLLEGYSADLAESVGLPIEKAKVSAKKQIDDLIPKGMKTDQHYFYVIRDVAKNVIGGVWYAVVDVRGKNCLFIYDIYLDKGVREQGFGTQTMRWLEMQAKALGLDDIRLHVFGHNERAQRLYKSLGYKVSSIQMSKKL